MAQLDNSECLVQFLLKTFQESLDTSCHVLAEMMETQAKLCSVERLFSLERLKQKTSQGFSCVSLCFRSPDKDVVGVVSVMTDSEHVDPLRDWACQGDEYLIDAISIEDFLYEFGNIYLNHIMAAYSKSIGARLVYSFPKLTNSFSALENTLKVKEGKVFPLSFVGSLLLESQVKLLTLITFDSSQNAYLKKLNYAEAS